MTNCRVCSAQTDGFICKGCLGEIEQVIAELPSALANLRAVETRQAAGPLGLGRASRQWDAPPEALARPVTPWPYSPGAQDQIWNIENEVGTWIRHLLESRGQQLGPIVAGPVCELLANPRDDKHRTREEMPRDLIHCGHQSCRQIREAAPIGVYTAIGFLLANIDAIRFDDHADDIHAAFANLADDNRTAILGRAEEEFYGVCDDRQLAPDFPAFAGPTCTALSGICRHESCDLIHRLNFDYIGAKVIVCGARLHAPAGDKDVRCDACGKVYSTTERNEAIRGKAADKLGTIAEAADLLTKRGYPVSVDMINGAISRHQIATYGVGTKGKLVKVGEVKAYLERRRGRVAV